MKENATKTSALQKRISSQKNQTVDLNEWIFEKINVKKNPKILELCCGTGAQTKYLSKIMGAGSLDCVDINQIKREGGKGIEKIFVQFAIVIYSFKK